MALKDLLSQLTSPDKAKKTDIYQLLVPSILGICLCVFCLVGSTFAWFSSTAASPAQSIQTASYSVILQVDSTVYTDPTLTLSPGEHRLIIQSGGDATTGYCIVKLGSQSLYTPLLPPGSEMTLTVTVSTETKLEVIPHWGEPTQAPDILDGGTYSPENQTQ